LRRKIRNIKEEIEAKNELDGLVYATEKSLKDHGDKVSGDERLTLDRALSEAKDALKSAAWTNE